MALGLSRAEAVHDESCPEIGPICLVRAERPQQHHTTLGLGELRLVGEYGLLDKLAIQAVLPLRLADSRTRYTDLQGHPVLLDYQNIHHQDGTLFGPGDAQVFAHSGLTFGDFLLGGRLGVSLPFGNVTPNPYALEAEGKPHQHLQFGTGTFDPIAGLDASWTFGKWSVAAFGFLHAPLYAGPRGYQAGTSVLGGLVLASNPGGSLPGTRLSMLFQHEFAERWGGRVPDEDGNLGRSDLFLGFGATFPFSDDWSASLDLNARVWGQVTGAQLDLPVVLQLSIGRLFHFESSSHEEFEADQSGDVIDVVAAGEVAPLEGVPGKWTVIDFWAPWCEACNGLDAKLRELAATRSDFAVRRVNIVDFDSPIARKELPGVELLPHLRLVAPNGRVAFDQGGPSADLLDAVMTTISP